MAAASALYWGDAAMLEPSGAGRFFAFFPAVRADRPVATHPTLSLCLLVWALWLWALCTQHLGPCQGLSQLCTHILLQASSTDPTKGQLET